MVISDFSWSIGLFDIRSGFSFGIAPIELDPAMLSLNTKTDGQVRVKWHFSLSLAKLKNDWFGVPFCKRIPSQERGICPPVWNELPPPLSMIISPYFSVIIPSYLSTTSSTAQGHTQVCSYATYHFPVASFRATAGTGHTARKSIYSAEYGARSFERPETIQELNIFLPP